MTECVGMFHNLNHSLIHTLILTRLDKCKFYKSFKILLCFIKCFSYMIDFNFNKKKLSYRT